jgi:hypothetical protein
MNAARRIRKKPLIGSASPAGTTRRETRVAAREIRARPASHAPMPPVDVAAAERDVDAAGAHRGDHPRQDGLVVLQVGVHDRNQLGRGREHALDARGREASAPDPLQAAHAVVAPSERAKQVGGAVGRIVVDEHHLPGDAWQRTIEPPHQFGDVLPLVEGWHDDREFGTGCRRLQRDRAAARASDLEHRGNSRLHVELHAWAGGPGSDPSHPALRRHPAAAELPWGAHPGGHFARFAPREYIGLGHGSLGRSSPRTLRSSARRCRLSLRRPVPAGCGLPGGDRTAV